MLDGRPLIAHACEAIAGSVDATTVCGREWGGLTALADLPRAGMGPLGGIAAALSHAQANGFDSVLTISCDMPEIPEELLAGLLHRAPSYCPDAPVLGHWPAGLADALAQHLAAPAGSSASQEHDRRLSIRGWAQSIGAIPIAAAGELRNINRPTDLLA